MPRFVSRFIHWLLAFNQFQRRRPALAILGWFAFGAIALAPRAVENLASGESVITVAGGSFLIAAIATLFFYFGSMALIWLFVRD